MNAIKVEFSSSPKLIPHERGFLISLGEFPVAIIDLQDWFEDPFAGLILRSMSGEVIETAEWSLPFSLAVEERLGISSDFLRQVIEDYLKENK